MGEESYTHRSELRNRRRRSLPLKLRHNEAHAPAPILVILGRVETGRLLSGDVVFRQEAFVQRQQTDEVVDL